MVALFIFFPLCMLKKIEMLKFTSFISFIATIYAGFLVTYVSSIPHDDLVKKGVLTNTTAERNAFDHPVVHFFGFPITVFAALPIVNVAFTAHYNGPRFYQELKDRSIPKFAKTVSVALG